jgi:hypothetical protein
MRCSDTDAARRGSAVQLCRSLHGLSFEIGLNSKTTVEQLGIRSAEPYLPAEAQRRSTGFPRIACRRARPAHASSVAYGVAGGSPFAPYCMVHIGARSLVYSLPTHGVPQMCR